MKPTRTTKSGPTVVSRGNSLIPLPEADRVRAMEGDALKEANPQAWADSATNVPPHLRDGAKQRRVVCAALRVRSSREANADLVIGPRHYDPIMRGQIATLVMIASGCRAEEREAERKGWQTAEQGFIDQWGTFMTREEALEVALAAGQRIYRCGGDEKRLYSENLY